MEKQFCTYEIALSLKKLGFIEPCLARYTKKGVDKIFYLSLSEICFDLVFNKFIYGRTINYNTKYYEKEGTISAPLRQQAIDWCFKQLDFYYPMLQLTVYSDDSGEWLQSKDDGVDPILIYFDNKDEMILKAIKIIKEKIK